MRQRTIDRPPSPKICAEHLPKEQLWLGEHKHRLGAREDHRMPVDHNHEIRAMDVDGASAKNVY